MRYQLTSDHLKNFRTIVEQNKDENAAIIQPTSIYPAGDEWHEGCVDDMHIIGQDSNERSPLYNHVGKASRPHALFLLLNPSSSFPRCCRYGNCCLELSKQHT